uniref:Cytochrome b/f complex 3.5 kDa subunit n=2 Tax=Spermatophyta TaxID=58024 RepID=A0A0H5AV71_DIOSP|nr:cytochrome b/f complex 3.5 kDa subunit [Dioon spinulosum]YP_009432895.1 cytochrome b/f complex 3.5 kDa subunit [Cryptocarya chinensis]BAR93653.1 cytochrome b/f complex 3.5 kDa subunit [Dioon spinulosum]BBA53446.1 cytochrome b/f complex 3.5 kDa subunit [Cryptocarya chinensis]
MPTVASIPGPLLVSLIPTLALPIGSSLIALL